MHVHTHTTLGNPDISSLLSWHDLFFFRVYWSFHVIIFSFTAAQLSYKEEISGSDRLMTFLLSLFLSSFSVFCSAIDVAAVPQSEWVTLKRDGAADNCEF